MAFFRWPQVERSSYQDFYGKSLSKKLLVTTEL